MHLHPVFSLLADVSYFYMNHEILAVGNNLSFKNHATVMQLMQDTIKRLNVGAAVNTIVHYDRAPSSYYHFKNYEKGIQQQPIPSHNL